MKDYTSPSGDGGVISLPRRYTHTECFAYFGTVPRNVQWSWSARNEQTGVVAVTLWRHEFKRAADGSLVFARGARDPESKSIAGHNELMTNLRWALDHCAGRVRVIVAVARDATVSPKQIASCAPTDMLAYVRQLDEVVGSFKIVASMKPLAGSAS